MIVYGIGDYRGGGRLRSLPVMTGATWSQTLNKQDDVDVTIDMRDATVRAAVADAALTPWKSTIFAEDTLSGNVVAAGIINENQWNNGTRYIKVPMVGLGGYFDKCVIGPPAAGTGTVILSNGKPNTALNTSYSNVSLQTIASRLMQQRLAWPNASMPYVFPDETAGTQTRSYPFLDLRSIGSAIDDLVNTVNGPDVRFSARRVGGPEGTQMEYPVSFGYPFLGSYLGSLPIGGPQSPVTELEVTDSGADLATTTWATGASTTNAVLLARGRNQSLLDAGYPPMDYVDTAHSSVVRQSTLNDYNAENAAYASALQRTLSFVWRTDARGIFMTVGDMLDLEIGSNNYYLAEGMLPIRITSISGDDRGSDLKIECVIWPRS